VGRFLKLYTELPVEECDRLGALGGAEINHAKVVLANEVTTLLHGGEAAQAAERTAREVFEAGGVGEDLPTIVVSEAQVAAGLANTALFVQAGLASSGKEAKRLFAEGGARINDEVVTEPRLLSLAEIQRGLKLTAGRKRHALVRMG
jgi:tyrosyl-tRNA synthetase